MVNKKVIIGLGVLVVAGIGYYMWKNKKPETTSKASGCDCDCNDEEEEESNVIGRRGIRKKVISSNKEVPMCTYTYNYRNESGELVQGTEVRPCPNGATTAPKAMVVARQAGGGGGICYIKITFPDGTTQIQEVACPTIKDKLPSARHYLPLSGNSCRGNDTLVNLGTYGKPVFRCESSKAMVVSQG
jgi:hypothetical protein